MYPPRKKTKTNEIQRKPSWKQSNRDEKKFAYLKQEEGKPLELQHRIGKFIPIPLLGEELEDFPKDFNPSFHIFF
jgi:hypothetical protein